MTRNTDAIPLYALPCLMLPEWPSEEKDPEPELEER